MGSCKKCLKSKKGSCFGVKRRQDSLNALLCMKKWRQCFSMEENTRNDVQNGVVLVSGRAISRCGHENDGRRIFM